LFSITKNDLRAGKPIDFTAVATHLRGEAELTLLSELVLGDLFEPGFFNRIEEALRPLERHAIDRRQLEIQREIADAEKQGDDERLARLIQEKMDIVRILKTLK
ncbi:MAG TPA: hypothetical protein VF057_13585, partial [Thermoanaerobaculia bacterium]